MIKILITTLLLVLGLNAQERLKAENSTKRSGYISPDSIITDVLFKVEIKKYDNAMRIRGYLNRVYKKEIYIVKMIAKIDGIVVYDMSTSQYISTNQEFWLSRENYIEDKIITFTIIDSSGKKEKQSYKLKYEGGILTPISVIEVSSLNIVPFNENIWKEKSSTIAIESLYGSKEMLLGTFKVIVPKYYRSEYSTIFIRRSKIDLETISIFIDGNPSAIVAIINIPDESIIKYRFSIKMVEGDTGFKCEEKLPITLIAKGKDGKLYKVTKEMLYGRCTGPDGE